MEMNYKFCTVLLYCFFFIEFIFFINPGCRKNNNNICSVIERVLILINNY